uniref:Salicylate synthetase n=1 Tax=Candidatus Kentrum sp. UNK TaxID=2126344 RepID=A0A451B290_9GAMM|nr:MAG: salicylate synthetase [Candidatus Kentron sp. UNK]VFK72408.1 MAG: salicylate synthetase [Candidatus Kentron sp. UNK]
MSDDLYDLVLTGAKQAVFEHTLTLHRGDPLILVETLIDAFPGQDYYVYEQPDSLHIALGVQTALTLERSTITLRRFGLPAVKGEWHGSISAIARRFFQSEGGHGWNMYGQVSFEYAAYMRGLRDIATLPEQSWPILSLVIPRTEVTLKGHNATIRVRETDTLGVIKALLGDEARPSHRSHTPSPVNTEVGQHAYRQMVAQAINEMQAGLYEKVILSRQICLSERIDMLATYLQARPKHTPSRSFLIKQSERQVAGFSPELVMAVKGENIITEPLAGTRALPTSSAEKAAMRHDLLTDPKEIVEHAISVREACNEMNLICQPNSVKVNDFMSIRERGSVQHLGSTVIGILKDDKDGWNALDVLFPAITASGIPKTTSIEVILRMEKQSRGLYSGAILMINDKEFEASLVLRSVFQEPRKSWIQAGAGLINLSNPDREFIETKEKLASIAPYIVLEADKSVDPTLPDSPN